MDLDMWRLERASRNGFLNPGEHVVTGASQVVAEIVVEAEVCDPSLFKELNHVSWPMHEDPTRRRRSTVIEKYSRRVLLHLTGEMDRLRSIDRST